MLSAGSCYSALSSDAFRQMFGTANKNSINFDDLIAARKVVLVRATKDGLGEDGQRVFFSVRHRAVFRCRTAESSAAAIAASSQYPLW